MTDRDELLEGIKKELQKVLTDDGIKKWWNTPIPAFGNYTPNALLELQRDKELLAHVKTYTEAVFS